MAPGEGMLCPLRREQCVDVVICDPAVCLVSPHAVMLAPLDLFHRERSPVLERGSGTDVETKTKLR